VRLFSPAIEQLQKAVLVDLKLLRRLALDARHNPGNEAIQAQLLIIL
jgi:hypothetical protein